MNNEERIRQEANNFYMLVKDNLHSFNDRLEISFFNEIIGNIFTMHYVLGTERITELIEIIQKKNP